MGKLIMLTLEGTEDKILVGSDNIIDAVRVQNKEITKVQLRHAMVVTHYVEETIEQIYNLSKD